MAAEELLNIAARIAVQQLSAPYRAAFERRIIGMAVCGGLAFIAGLAGVTCGVLAFWLWLTPLVGPATAALIATVVLFLVALSLGLAAAGFGRRSPSRPMDDVLKSKELGLALEKYLPELLIAAAVGGLVFGLRRRR